MNLLLREAARIRSMLRKLKAPFIKFSGALPVSHVNQWFPAQSGPVIIVLDFSLVFILIFNCCFQFTLVSLRFQSGLTHLGLVFLFENVYFLFNC